LAEQAVGYQEEMLDVGGESLHVLRGGAGEPLLFLHGAGGAGFWLPFFDRLAERFDVIAPTHPGFGRSSDMESTIEAMDDLVYFYLDLIDRLELHDINLVGTSLGGWLAAELAVTQPQRFRRLVLMAPVGLELPEAPVKDMFGMSPDETVAAVFHDPSIAAQIFPAEPDLDFVLGLYREKITFAKLAWNPYCANPKLERRLHRISAPTLVLWGEQDELVPIAHGRRYVERIPNASLKTIPNVSHGSFIEDPEATAGLILDFLQAG